LQNGTVYIAFGSFFDANPYHGWLFGYDAATLQQLSVYNSSPNGHRAAFWQSGAGISADSAGNLYLATANGDFDIPTGGSSSGDHVVQELPGAFPTGVHGMGAYFETSAYKSIYYGGMDDHLRAFAISGAALSTTPTSQSPTGLTGTCTPIVTANGTSNAIVW